MAVFAPQFELYKIANIIKKISNLTFWIIVFLTIVPIILVRFKINWQIDDTLNILNIISILFFFILDNVNNLIIIPQAELKRRDDFVDNSFKSGFATSNSIGYFDNEEINYGFYKAAINLFQNCFFTYELTKKLTFPKIIIPAIAFITLLVFSYFGFKQVPFFLSLLQILLSANIAGVLIKHLILINRLQVIYDDCLTIFQYDDFNNTTQKYNPSIMRNWLRYEALLARLPLDIPDKLFNRHNSLLSDKWNKIKEKYNIC
ncbi:MAG: hypothetical protein ACTHJ0_02595 [Flavipsychrobacter sp.]